MHCRLEFPSDEGEGERLIRLNSFLTITGTFSVMIGNLYVLGSCERHSKPTKEMCMFFGPTSKGDTLCCRLCNWATNRNWETKLLDTGKTTQLNLFLHES